ncbi:MAG: sugar transferase [Clostridia bacterium]|nr:sugar transferase [Clostridia bacterium]
MNKNSVSERAAAEAAVPSGKNAVGTYAAAKRAMDVLFSVIALILLCIPMLLISLLIRIDARDKAIFTQKRVGRDEKVFECYKFRTMKREAPRYCAKKDLADADAFITRTGRFLRKTSLDELPQLWNVLKGDMSFIGPRPLIREEVSVHEMRRACGVYRVRPGISGYAQINGRDMISDERKVELDKYYLDHFSFALDVRILFGTVLKVLKKQDIHQGALEAPDK